MTENTESWEQTWEVVGGNLMGGGQATVVKVRSKSSGIFGALKILREQHRTSSERRYRVQAEVAALSFMNGDGVPRVLATNAGQWKNEYAELFLITEWIDGTVLSNAGITSLDSAIACVHRLAETLERAHSAGILHRDIKPDNVICRSGDLAMPVLLDFGMAWNRPPEPKDAEFSTPLGIEIGNRFLRLPENAPGRESRDERSDIAALAGVLFFLLTSHAPRVLVDEQGRMPHERSVIPVELRDDPRWARLQLIFSTAFQQRIDFRYETMAAFRAALARVVAASSPGVDVDNLQDLKDRITALTQSETNRKLEHIDQLLKPALSDLKERFSKFFSEGERRGSLMPKMGAVNNFTSPFVVIQGVGGTRSVKVEGRFRWTTQGSEVTLSYMFPADISLRGTWTMLYHGPVADVESLINAQASALPKLSREILAELAVTLERTLHRK